MVQQGERCREIAGPLMTRTVESDDLYGTAGEAGGDVVRRWRDVHFLPQVASALPNDFDSIPVLPRPCRCRPRQVVLARIEIVRGQCAVPITRYSAFPVRSTSYRNYRLMAPPAFRTFCDRGAAA